MGVPSAPSTVTLNGETFGGVWSYDASNKVLAVKGLQTATKKGAWSAEWTLKWS
jgi:alpha-glucosidase